MTITRDPVELAQVIAAIASRTSEPRIARELMNLADRLLTAAGLPPLPAREKASFA
jgi:hypothetical protein